MSELAYNINGEAFEVPANATGWRVRRMRAKGSPEVVYGREGTPLVLAIDAELDDLRTEVDVTGRYRLDLVDQNNKALASAPSGYVQINLDPPAVASTAPTVTTGTSESIVLEAMRMNTELARTVIDRFPQMMEAAAVLLQAADGAGLPARLPIPRIDDEDEDDDDDEVGDEGDEKPAGFDVGALVTQLLPLILGGVASGKIKMPDLGSVLDWRKAGKKAPKPTAPASQPATTATEPVASAAASLPPLDPAAMAHVIAVQSALEPQEVAYIQAIAKELSPAELRGWFDELSKLSVPDAVTRVRGLIAGKNGGAS